MAGVRMTKGWRAYVVAGLLTGVPASCSGQSVAVPSSDVEWEALSSQLEENPYLLAGADRETALEIIETALRDREDGVFWAAYGPGICVVPAPDRVRMTGESRREAFRTSSECLERILVALPASVEAPGPEMVRSMLVRPLAEALFEAGDLNRADSVALEELQRRPGVEAGTGGDVQYEMNQIRGRVALRRQQREAAIEFLRRAGQSEGSPQLSSFGPRFTLARELLEVGERDTVLRHLDAVEAFWTGPDARTKLAEARRTIRAGGVPNDVAWR